MAIELSYDTIRVDQIVGRNSTQALVEGDIVVPDSKPDISKILDIDGTISVNSIEVIQDKIMMDGVINFNILYLSQDKNVSLTSMHASTNFNHSVEIAGAGPKMRVETAQQLENIEFNLLNSRKLNVKAVVSIDGKVINDVQLDMVKEVNGLDDIQLMTQKIQNKLLIGSESSQTMVKENVEVPASMPVIKEILKTDAKAVVKDVKSSDNKVMLHGEVIATILYSCDDAKDPVQKIDTSLPFDHFVEIAGSYQGADLKTKAEIKDIYMDVKEDINNERRIIDAEIIVGVSASAYDLQEKNGIVDVYSPSVDLDIEKKDIGFETVSYPNDVQNHIKESIQLPEGSAKILKLLMITGKPIITDQSISEGKADIEGIMESNIIYLSDNEAEPVQNYSTEFPFKNTLDIEGIDKNNDIDINVAIDSIDYVPVSKEEIDVDYTTVTDYSVITKNVQNVLVNVKESEQQGAGMINGITIYFSQPGDTLWNIAKNFHTTIESILKYNNVDETADLLPETKIFLYNKFDPFA